MTTILEECHATRLEAAPPNFEEIDMGSLNDGDWVMLHDIPVRVLSRQSDFIWADANHEIRTIKIAFMDSVGDVEVRNYLADSKIYRIYRRRS